MKIGDLCGACHQWGCDPRLENARCVDCNRTEHEIAAAHSGVVRLTPSGKAYINLCRLRALGHTEAEAHHLVDLAFGKA